jgi:diadenosine tetraphosphate (Ap4A) HIT family hydrolase
MTAWDDLKNSHTCYLCSPREPDNDYRRLIAPLSVSTFYLFTDQRFRGYSLLIFDPYHATELEQLSAADYDAYTQDLRRAASALRAALKPDHMNYELLGNSNPHLHWHIVPRFKDDLRWGQPIWEGWPRDEFNANRQKLSEAAYQALVDQIRAALSAYT